MYRFPKDLDLTHLTGCEVVQVAHAPYNLLFSLEPENRINIAGAWRIIDADNKLVDEGNEQESKDAYRTHLLLGQKIQKCTAMDPMTLTVMFESGWKLEILDDSDQYESCHISPNIYI
jgi:hypothetical protein